MKNNTSMKCDGATMYLISVRQAVLWQFRRGTIFTGTFTTLTRTCIWETDSLLILARFCFATKRSSVKVPINANKSPPVDFYSRDESDRYVPGTKPTLIRMLLSGQENVDGLLVMYQLICWSIRQYLGPRKQMAGGFLLALWTCNSHLGDGASPSLSGSSDTNSRKGLVQPLTLSWIRDRGMYPPRVETVKARILLLGRVYSGTRMIQFGAYRKGLWLDNGMISGIPEGLGECLVDVLRRQSQVRSAAFLTLTNIAAFHHGYAKKYHSVIFLLTDFQLMRHTWFRFAQERVRTHPRVALFATNGRTSVKLPGLRSLPSTRRWEGIQVVMKSDHPVLTRVMLLHEAQQAHYFGLADNLALASVISTPATIMGQEHRIGYIRKGYDADIVLWDSHPLAIGVTPKQVFIDGVAQLENPFTSTKPKALQHAPETPNFDEETKAALKYDGLPPLEPKEITSDVVVFTNFDSLFLDLGNGVEQIFASQNHSGAPQIAVVKDGKIICTGTSEMCSPTSYMTSRTINLHGGSLAPGLLSYGSELGLAHISGEKSTQDGKVFDGLTDKVPSILGGDEAVIRAVDGLLFSTRDALLAYRSGVTAG
ncbi:hypothetical protein BT96DRAFT_982620, partial [Gymnopus androsaceus JB14]